MRKYIGIMLTILPLSACTTYVEPVATAQNITLEEGVASISRAIDTLDREREGKPKIGIYLDNVVVTFNVNAKRTSNGTAGLTLASVPVISGGTLGANASQVFGAEGSRGNRVVMTFKSTAYLAGSKKQEPTPPQGVPNGVPNVGNVRTWSQLSPQDVEAIKRFCKKNVGC